MIEVCRVSALKQRSIQWRGGVVSVVLAVETNNADGDDTKLKPDIVK